MSRPSNNYPSELRGPYGPDVRRGQARLRVGLEDRGVDRRETGDP